MRTTRLMIAALTLIPPAAASAMLATTPACELLSEAEATRAIGQIMLSLGGTADFEHMSECFWQADGGGASMQFTLTEGGMFSPSGQTAHDHFNYTIDALKAAGEPFEVISGVGNSAILMEPPEGRSVILVAGGNYLRIGLGDGTRRAILAVAEIAATHMAD